MKTNMTLQTRYKTKWLLFCINYKYTVALNEDRISFVPHRHPLPNLNKPPGNTKKTCPAKRKEKIITTLSNKKPCLIMDHF